ncbi:hypothetical protein S40285_03257 [Stachybotrys chlorohalonatus IBT 40285]|uniref:Zn(2)-C6 fungal-type domain-containing protein n=1 Tax=Stachybotrys chlorohalonatus (strain IBT 40285) TaxID=1283841 RepID=A0A084QGV8_STAC4|nr:hypothetical protein S40285_03257 [Stachybotrys chlorohalonata IBT 40285]
MSYQYPPPPDDDLVGKAKPSFSLEHDTLPQQLSTPVAKGQDFQPKTLGRETARSYASSSLPPQGMHPSTEPVLEDPSAVPAQGEKKKNRLGYHRISIACTHCRRRKIRCITSRDDQAHCVNCIRLKKECIFNPVTPPAPMDSFSKFAPRAPSSSRMLKSSSSSPSAPNYAFDASKEPILPAVTVPGFQNLVLSSSPVNDGNSFSHVTKGPPMLNQAYSMGSPPLPGWIPTEGIPATSRSENASTPWRGYPMESPIAPHYPPFNSTTTENSWTTGLMDSGSRGEIAWSGFPPSSRSMSYSNDNLGNSPQGQYMLMSMSQPDHRGHGQIPDAYPIPVPHAHSGHQPALHHSSSFSGPLQSSHDTWTQ